jgi:hypothetical protein
VAIVLTLLVGVGRVSATPQSGAERLVDRLPDRTLMVLAWSGGDQVGEDFRQTAVGRTLDEESIRSFVTDLKNAIWSAMSAEWTEPPDKVALETVRDAWPVITRSPGAVVIVAGDPQADFAISIALVLEAHKFRDKIEGMLTRVNTVIEPPKNVRIADVNLKSIPGKGLVWGWVGERFVIGLGDLTHLVRSLSTGKNALSDSETFRKRLAAVPGEREILLLYVDVTAAARMVRLCWPACSPEDPNSLSTPRSLRRPLAGACGSASRAESAPIA